MVNSQSRVIESTPLLRVNTASSQKMSEGSHTIIDVKNDNSDTLVSDASRQQMPIQNLDIELTWGEVMKKTAPFLYPEGAKHTTCLILALTLVVISKLVNILPPLAIKHAVDIMSNSTIHQFPNQDQYYPSKHEASTRILKSILAYFGLKLLSSILSTLQGMTQRSVTLDAERRFGIMVFSHLQHLSLSYHLEKHIGEITQIMSRGSDSISSLVNAFIFSLLPTLFETAVVTTVFAKLGIPLIAFTTLVTVVIFFCFSYFVTQTRIRYRREVNQASDGLSLQETETLVNFETVLMFGRTLSEIETYKNLRQKYKDSRETLMHIFQMLQFTLSFIRLSGTSVGFLIAGWQTVYANPPLSPGSFVVVNMYIDQLFQPLSALAVTYRNLIQAFTDLEKAVTMLNRTPDVKDAPDAYIWRKNENQEKSSGEITFKNVSFYYKMNSKKRALGSALVDDIPAKNHRRLGRWSRGGGGEWKKSSKIEKNEINSSNNYVKKGITKTSFCIPAGKTAALVGRSGSGKTTIIRLILRMYDPDEGSIYIDGHDVKNITQNSLRENIGVVAQDTVLFNTSLRENIVYGKPDATEEEIWNAVHLAALTEFVQGLPNKLETIVGDRGMKLSGGERQRVGLARCVIKNPKLILLDEATSALDSGTEKTIQKNIADICKSRTTLMIAHRLSTARYADKIIVLEKGELFQSGTHEELMSQENGLYAKMWADQTQPDSEYDNESAMTSNIIDTVGNSFKVELA